MRTIKDEASKALFLGKKAGDSFELNVNEVFVNEADRAAMLKVKKEELASMDPMWKFTIVEVKNYVDAVPGQELYDMLFGKDAVKTEEEFDAKLAERMAAEYAEETDYRFILDAREYIINKANITLPEDFMKRWLFAANQGKFTMEQIEQEFPAFAKDFRWQTITQRIIKEQKLEIKKEDMLEQAKKLAKYQFASYGIPNVPEEYLVKHAESLIANENEGRRIFEKVEETKVLDYVRSVVTIEKKKISLDKFQKLQ
jgi:trigger factor